MSRRQKKSVKNDLDLTACGKYVMVDMDGTLIQSVMPEDPFYSVCPGKIIQGSGYKFKVNIRPGAPEMIQTLVDSGHNYILWSAGKRDYVHSVMNYFNSISGKKPILIRTRDDMVELPPDSGRTMFKSNTHMGAEIENLLIIEDDPSLVNPDERNRVYLVPSWNFQMVDDCEMNKLSIYLSHQQKRFRELCTESKPVKRDRKFVIRPS